MRLTSEQISSSRLQSCFKKSEATIFTFVYSIWYFIPYMYDHFSHSVSNSPLLDPGGTPTWLNCCNAHASWSTKWSRDAQWSCIALTVGIGRPSWPHWLRCASIRTTAQLKASRKLLNANGLPLATSLLTGELSFLMKKSFKEAPGC